VLQCRSTTPLHSRPVRGDELKCRSSTDLRLDYKVATHPLLDRLYLFEPLSEEEKKQLGAKVVRRHFKAGEQLLMQGVKAESVQFVFYGVIEITRQVEAARELKLGRLGPADSFGKISLLTGMAAEATFTALSSGLLLGLCSADLKPILESRPQLVESLSHLVAKQQHLLDVRGEAAIHRVVAEQTDLLSRIRTFFCLNV
jgi:CRP-like cAMP-binding protein